MKKNKFIIVYSIIASIAILFALAFLGYNLYSEYNHGYERTKRRFDHLTSSIKKLSENQFSSKQQYLTELEKLIGNTTDFSYLEIKENGNTIYIFPDADAKSDLSSKLIKNYYDYFKINENMIYFTGDLYILRPASIYYYSKISFLIILIVTLVTLIFVIYFNIHDPDVVAKSEISNPVITEDNVFENTFEQNSTTTQTEIVNETEVETESIDSEISDEKEKIDLPYKEFEPAQINTIQGESLEPSGLFSTTTGIGWESYLLTRLENELNRAISSEYDLSVFIIQLPELSRTSDKIKNVCDYLITQFQYKDLLFEYHEDSIVAIKDNINLDAALVMADKLYVDIKNIIDGSNKCYIGISTRAIRMVAGERLLKEAEEALQHAHEDSENPIIAFRANAEKYRQFLEKNS